MSSNQIQENQAGALASVDDDRSRANDQSSTDSIIRDLAAFQCVLRTYEADVDQIIRGRGITPAQYHVLLEIAGSPRSTQPTVGYVAECLAVKSHSAVEVVDRLVQRHFVRRIRTPWDRRRSVLELTAVGAELVPVIADDHRREIERSTPHIVESLLDLGVISEATADV